MNASLIVNAALIVNPSFPALKINFHPAYRFLLMAGVLHLSTLILFWWCFSGLSLIFLTCLLALTFLYAVTSQNPKRQNFIQSLTVAPDLTVTVATSGYGSQRVALKDVAWSSSVLLILIWQPQTKKSRGIRQVVWPDACSPEEFHQLLVTVNWCLPRVREATS